MKWLVTGANGFLGRHVVARFRDAGESVRALVRPAADIDKLGWDSEVEVYRGDLRRCPNLDRAFDDVDGLIHVAAAVSGSPEEQFASTVVATEKLLDAMSRSTAKRLVLIGSMSVYDWRKIGGSFDESVPLESDDVYARDGYAVAKLWQERVVRQKSAEEDWGLTVLRPGFIWGPGNEWCVGLGDVRGNKLLVIGPNRRLPLTHVLNCADCVYKAAISSEAIGESFNVVDEAIPKAWRLAGDYASHAVDKYSRIPIPYYAAAGIGYCAQLVSRMWFGKAGRLPGVLVPRRFTARFKSSRFSAQRLKDKLGWTPPYDYAECLEKTYPTRRPKNTSES